LGLVALVNPEPFVGKAPQLFTSDLSLVELAQELTGLLGRPIRYREISSEEWVRETVEREGGTNQEALDHLVNLWKELLILNQNQEFMTRMSQGHDAFRRMTGEPPISLGEWLKLNQAALESDDAFQSHLK
jgi:hypothetical protein